MLHLSKTLPWFGALQLTPSNIQDLNLATCLELRTLETVGWPWAEGWSRGGDTSPTFAGRTACRLLSGSWRNTGFTPSRRGSTAARTHACPPCLAHSRDSVGPAAPSWLLAGGSASLPPGPARACPAARLPAPGVGRVPLPVPPFPAVGGGATDLQLVIGRSLGATLLRPLPRGERSAELRSAGATMAGLWVGEAALVTAGRRGRRWPQPLLRSAALWTLKVRSAGTPRGPGPHWAPSLAPPGGGQCCGERSVCARATPGAGFRVGPRP